MSERMHIPAKQTRYRGITYRSRLEATWAVFWHYVGERSTESRIPFSYHYESFESNAGQSFQGQAGHYFAQAGGFDEGELEQLAKYCPDFRIAMGAADGSDRKVIIFQEIKPIMPSDEYVKILKGVSWLMGMYGYPLILTVGSFRENGFPVVISYPYHSFTVISNTMGLLGLGEVAAKATEHARNFRWDLYRE